MAACAILPKSTSILILNCNPLEDQFVNVDVCFRDSKGYIWSILDDNYNPGEVRGRESRILYWTHSSSRIEEGNTKHAVHCAKRGLTANSALMPRLPGELSQQYSRELCRLRLVYIATRFSPCSVSNRSIIPGAPPELQAGQGPNPPCPETPASRCG